MTAEQNDWMTDSIEKPSYAALAGVQASVGALDVLLIVRKSRTPAERTVLAISAEEARWLYNEDRLDGWTPTEPDGATTP